MRYDVDSQRLRQVMESLGHQARGPMRVYLTGGSCAVLMGWRPQTMDLDLRLEPERSEIFSGIPRLKRELQVNIEFASPQDFLPELPGWRDRSLFIRQCGSVSFFHYDFYAQALSKIERGHQKDLRDVRAMIGDCLVEPARLLPFLESVEDEFGRYPALDFEAVREQVHQFLQSIQDEPGGRL